MSELKYPQPDGRVRVVDSDSGETLRFDQNVSTPFGRGGDPEPRVVELPESSTGSFGVPAGTAEEARVQTVAKPPDMTEQLSNEAERQKPQQYPVGAPELKSLLKLPFRQRARAMALYQAAIDAWNAMPQGDTVMDTPDKLERYFNALGAFDDFLGLVAVNKAAYDSWVAVNDDGTFGELFFAYIVRFGLGEASSSSS